MPPVNPSFLPTRSVLRASNLFVLLLCTSAAIVALPLTTEAAVARLGSVQTFTSSAITSSQNISVPAGADIMTLVVGGFDGDDVFSGGTITLGGNALQIGFDGDDNGSTAHQGILYYIDVSSLSGVQSLAWTWNGSGSLLIGANFLYAFYDGVDTTSPIRASGGQQDTDGNFTTGTLAAVAGDMIVAGMAFTSNATVAWSGATEALNTSDFNGNMTSVAEESLSGNTTVSTTLTVGDPDGSLMALALAAGPTHLTLSKPANNLGLVAYWSFNEGVGTTAGDVSGNNHHGTLTNSPAWMSGKRGQALRFDSADSDFVSVAQGGAFNLHSGPFTISAWLLDDTTAAEMESIPSFHRAISWYDGTTNIQLGLSPNNTDQRAFYISNSAALEHAKLTTSGNISNGWHHVVATFDGASTYKLYVDGVDSNAGDAAWNNTTPYTGDSTTLYIGQRGNGQYWNGNMDEVRIYSRAIGASEVAKLYGSGAVKINTSTADLDTGSSLERGLVGHWTFDGKDTQSTITDRSGQSNHGYFNGGATSSAKKIGKLGQAFRFDGVNDYVSIAQNGDYNLSGSAFTISAWVLEDTSAATMESIPVFKRFVSWYDGSKNIQLGLSPNITDNRAFYISNSALLEHAKLTTSGSISNGWHHLVATFDGASTYKIYVDGSDTNAGDDAWNNTTPYTGDSTTLYIGQRANGGFVDGLLDDVRIYSRALTADEVRQLYKLGTVRITQ